MLIQALTGDERAQVVDVAFALGVRAPTEERVQEADEDNAQQQEVDRAELNRQARADGQAVTGGEEDGVAPVLREAAPGQRVAGEDFVGGDGLPDQEGGEGDERGNDQIKPGDGREGVKLNSMLDDPQHDSGYE